MSLPLHNEVYNSKINKDNLLWNWIGGKVEPPYQFILPKYLHYYLSKWGTCNMDRSCFAIQLFIWAWGFIILLKSVSKIVDSQNQYTEQGFEYLVLTKCSGMIVNTAKKNLVVALWRHFSATIWHQICNKGP